MRLEVIATSLEDAVEAEAGGADRIELVRDLAADHAAKSERPMSKEAGDEPQTSNRCALFLLVDLGFRLLVFTGAGATSCFTRRRGFDRS